jgi:hypothetical protein
MDAMLLFGMSFSHCEKQAHDRLLNAIIEIGSVVRRTYKVYLHYPYNDAQYTESDTSLESVCCGGTTVARLSQLTERGCISRPLQYGSVLQLALFQSMELHASV